MTNITGSTTITTTSGQYVLMIDPTSNEVKKITVSNFQSALPVNPAFTQDLNVAQTSSTTETIFRNYIISALKLYTFNASGNSVPGATSTTATLRFYFNGNLLFTLAGGLSNNPAQTFGWTINIRVTQLSNTTAMVQIVGAVNGATTTQAAGTAFNVTGVNWTSGIAFRITGQVSVAGSMQIYQSDDNAYF